MPLFEYRCGKCGRKFAKLVGMTADSTEPACPNCGSKELTKLISRFMRVRGEDEKLDAFEDAALSAGAEDPRSMSRLMGEMAREMGDDLGEDADELVAEAEREIYDGEMQSEE
jgi:putative FmdB family regulatory protein